METGVSEGGEGEAQSKGREVRNSGRYVGMNKVPGGHHRTTCGQAGGLAGAHGRGTAVSTAGTDAQSLSFLSQVHASDLGHSVRDRPGCQESM